MCFKAHSFILAKNFAIDQIQIFYTKTLHSSKWSARIQYLFLSNYIIA